MNALYDYARRSMLSSTFDWPSSAMRMLAFADTTYVFNEAHEFVGDIGPPAAESLEMTGKMISSGGYARGDHVWFSGPPLTTPWQFLVIVDETGGLTGNGRKLVAYYDQGVNLPRIINGQDEIVIPDWSTERGFFRP